MFPRLIATGARESPGKTLFLRSLQLPGCCGGLQALEIDVPLPSHVGGHSPFRSVFDGVWQKPCPAVLSSRRGGCVMNEGAEQKDLEASPGFAPYFTPHTNRVFFARGKSSKKGGADLFLDYYAAKSKLLRYSSGLFAPKDRFILFSLYQCR